MGQSLMCKLSKGLFHQLGFITIQTSYPAKLAGKTPI